MEFVTCTCGLFVPRQIPVEYIFHPILFAILVALNVWLREEANS